MTNGSAGIPSHDPMVSDRLSPDASGSFSETATDVLGEPSEEEVTSGVALGTSPPPTRERPAKACPSR